jgi:hypothetical protein
MGNKMMIPTGAYIPVRKTGREREREDTVAVAHPN